MHVDRGEEGKIIIYSVDERRREKRRQVGGIKQ